MTADQPPPLQLYCASYDACAFTSSLSLSSPSGYLRSTNYTPVVAAAALSYSLMPVGSVDSGLGGEMEVEDHLLSGRARSSSEEKDSLTPAQSKRKAQNRAAQRAFRERKERHVRDLETKLSELESSRHSLMSDNERLKLELQKARTENEILRATARNTSPSSRPLAVSYPSTGAHLRDDDQNGALDSDDHEYSIQPLDNGNVMNTAEKTNSAFHHRQAAGKVVPATQTWDVIQEHPLVKQDLVDIADVMQRLKGAATCDGNGPAFEEATIQKAIEDSNQTAGMTFFEA